MTDPAPPPGLRPVPGTARGRGRIIVDLSDVVDRGTRRRAGVFRRALRREYSRLHDPRRIAAILLLSLTFAVVLSGLIARGEAGGADARAYWAGVRIWLNGGDPYHPIGPFLPYVYAPWMLPLFAPWAVLPWDVAWFLWRVGTILLLLWTIHWAYRRRPLTTAIILAVLAFPFGANLDTGNINLQLTLMLWAAQFTGPRLGGLLWALATWMKWVPVVFWPILPRPGETLGTALAGGLGRPQPADAAADDHPAPGAVRLRGAPGQARLPGLPVGPRPVALPEGRPVRLPASGHLARSGSRTPGRDSAGRLRADQRLGQRFRQRGIALAPSLVDRPQQQRPDRQPDRPEQEGEPRADGGRAGPHERVDDDPTDDRRGDARSSPSRRSRCPCSDPTRPSG